MPPHRPLSWQSAVHGAWSRREAAWSRLIGLLFQTDLLQKADQPRGIWGGGGGRVGSVRVCSDAREEGSFCVVESAWGPHSCYLLEHAKRGRGPICALCKTWSFGGCVWPGRQERKTRKGAPAGSSFSYLRFSGCQLLTAAALGVVHAWRPAPPVSADRKRISPGYTPYPAC